MDKPWLKHYPAGMPAGVSCERHPSLAALFDASFERYGDRPALRFMGRGVGYRELDAASHALAAWLQGRGLQRGDRVAVMLPNVPQYAVAVAAILRAGCVVVNVDPACTQRALEHQLKDSGAKAIVVIEHACALLAQALDRVPTRHVVVAALGDMLGLLRGSVANHVERNVRKAVPEWQIDGAVRFNRAVADGMRLRWTPPRVGPDDIAVLQYTGGTTGLSRGAVLLHRNLVANVLQCAAWYAPAFARVPADEQLGIVCALPLHQIFGFSSNMLLGLHAGACNILVPDARDPGGLLRALQGERFHSFPAVDTVLQRLLQHPDFDAVDWSALVLCVAGGMPVQQATARQWLERTGCIVCEGYGLSETSPCATCNPVDAPAWNGSIGLPLPGTEVRLLDDAGRPVPAGAPGEIAIRGPQVMAGYWQRPDETARVMTADGFLRTGDIGTMDERGFCRVVDRKKDMILVSGFNVFPNEIEDVVAQMPGVLEAAAIGVPDPRAGEAVKLVVVRKDPAVREDDVHAWCEANLTGYKRPKVIEFRSELPKTPVGKILRRELRT